jgi:hypothetical protein
MVKGPFWRRDLTVDECWAKSEKAVMEFNMVRCARVIQRAFLSWTKRKVKIPREPPSKKVCLGSTPVGWRDRVPYPSNLTLEPPCRRRVSLSRHEQHHPLHLEGLLHWRTSVGVLPQRVAPSTKVCPRSRMHRGPPPFCEGKRAEHQRAAADCHPSQPRLLFSVHTRLPRGGRPPNKLMTTAWDGCATTTWSRLSERAHASTQFSLAPPRQLHSFPFCDSPNDWRGHGLCPGFSGAACRHRSFECHPAPDIGVHQSQWADQVSCADYHVRSMVEVGRRIRLSRPTRRPPTLTRSSSSRLT